MVLKTSWVSRQKVEMDRRMKKSEPKATYFRDRDTDRERGEFAQSYHYESTTVAVVVVVVGGRMGEGKRGFPAHQRSSESYQ